jgi:UDP-N-acetylmuramoyl-tripeptide--D-alanyl-D-alanine ligase
MGMYGPGEIRALCRWVRPTVGVITAIGPVHLERLGSIEAIARAKAEILEGVEVAVLNVDAPFLADEADGFAARGKVVRCSATDPTADVHVAAAGGRLAVRVGGAPLAEVDVAGAHPSNVACAVGAAVALDVPPEVIARQLAALPVADHRQQVATSATGVTVVDDTFNANPAGAAAGVTLLAALGTGRRVVVTPGLVELGAMAVGENHRLAERAAAVATDVVVVGRTNRDALLAGARGGRAAVHVVATRQEAVAWVRAHLGPGDAVLYENDLPDHYP